MAIDYNKRPKPTPEQPPAAPAAPPAAPATGPSWYRPPGEDEAQPPTAAAPPPSYQQPPAAPQPPAQPGWPTPPAAAAPPAAPAWPAQPAAPAPSAPPAWPTPPAAPPTPSWPAPPAAAAPPAATGWPTPPSAAPQNPPAYGQPPTQAAPPSSGVSLSKVTLSKAAPSVSLSKSGGATGIIRINLNWTASAKPSGGGFLRRLAGGGNGIDLDLGCLYELSDGRKGVVQALGNSFGSLHSAPYIQLDGDDRTGSQIAGETMQINLVPGRFRRILIFAFIYDGAPNWAAADGVVTLNPVQGPQIEVRLDATSGQARSCAIAQLIDNGGDLVVQREVQYINGGQSKIDAAYNWGMDWSPGRK